LFTNSQQNSSQSKRMSYRPVLTVYIALYHTYMCQCGVSLTS